MSKSTPVLSLLILSVAFLASCGDRAPTEPSPTSEPTESKEERDRRAAMLYRRFSTSEYGEKIEGLTEVAHTYWDTPTGPVAARELVLYLLDDPGDDPSRALAEVRRLRKRRPDSEEVMTSTMILTYAIQKRLLQDDVDPKRELREKLFEEARELFVEVAEDFCGRPENADRADMFLEWGNSYMLAGEFAKAEAAWARVDDFTEQPSAILRMRLLVKRANVLREKLEGFEQSLALFRRAEKVVEEIGEVDPVLRRHISDAITALEAKIGG